jgi:hypothetical protein
VNALNSNKLFVVKKELVFWLVGIRDPRRPEPTAYDKAIPTAARHWC